MVHSVLTKEAEILPRRGNFTKFSLFKISNWKYQKVGFPESWENLTDSDLKIQDGCSYLYLIKSVIDTVLSNVCL